MKITRTITPRNGEEWRDWLAANHDKEQEIWVVYFKAASQQSGVDYESSVEEALCFGWVDSLIQKIDEERYARKFNPRRPGSIWSASNKRRAEKLILEGRMTPVGLAKYDPEARESISEDAQKIRRAEAPVPDEIIQALASNQRAWNYFQSLAPSAQRQHAAWIMSAKLPATRQNRLEEVIALLEQGKKLGLK